MLLALLACDDPAPPTGHDTASTEDSAADTAGDTAGDTAPDAPYACDDVPEPDLVHTTWSPAGKIPVDGLATFGNPPGAWPLYLGSHSTGTWRLDDGDTTWRRLPVGVTHTNADLVVDADAPFTVFRSAGGALERTDDGGQSWERLEFGVIGDTTHPYSGAAFAIGLADDDTVFGVLNTGVCAWSGDGGETWNAGEDAPIEPISASYEDFQGWRLSVGDGRLLFTDTNVLLAADTTLGGWEVALDQPIPGAALVRDPATPTRVRAGDWTSEDDGRTWTEAGPGGVVAAAWGGFLAVVTADALHTSDDGVAFTQGTLPTTEVAAVAVVDDEVFVTGSDGVWRSADRGGTWTSMDDGLYDGGMAVVAGHPTCPQVVFTGSRCTGGLFRSDDWGTTWANAAAGHVHPGDDTGDTGAGQGDGEHLHFHYVMDVVVDPTDPARVYAVSDDALWASDDAGETWATLWTEFHFHGFAVHPEDGDVLLMGSVGDGEWADETANIYRSEDRGLTWSATAGLPESDSSAQAIAYLDADTVFAGFYLGSDVNHWDGEGIGLYRSEDGGRTWAETPLVPRDVAGVAIHAGEVWAATLEGLWRSDDRGETWTEVLEGEVLSVAFHGDDGLAMTMAGEVLRSRDGGASWEVVLAEVDGYEPTNLARVAYSGDGRVGWATVYGKGVWRARLD